MYAFSLKWLLNPHHRGFVVKQRAVTGNGRKVNWRGYRAEIHRLAPRLSGCHIYGPPSRTSPSMHVECGTCAQGEAPGFPTSACWHYAAEDLVS